jgi:pimeloyl-ACP methyl ester carboxylesterase
MTGTFTINVTDFSMGAQASVSTTVGTPVTITEVINSVNGFSGPVQVSFAQDPVLTVTVTAVNGQAITPVVNAPVTVNVPAGGATVTYTVLASAARQYAVTMTGTDADPTHGQHPTRSAVVQVNVTVPPTDFTMGTPSPSTITVYPTGNASGTFNEVITGVNSSTGPINLTYTVPAQLAGLLTFSPSSISGPSTVIVTATASLGTPQGNYSVTVTAADPTGAIRHSVPLQVTKTGPPTITMSSPTPSPVLVASSQPLTFTVTVSAVNGFTGPVSFSAPSVPLCWGGPNVQFANGINLTDTAPTQTVSATIYPSSNRTNSSAVNSCEVDAINLLFPNGRLALFVPVQVMAGSTFTVNGPTSPVTLYINSAATQVTLQVNPVSGFTGTVSFSTTAPNIIVQGSGSVSGGSVNIPILIQATSAAAPSPTPIPIPILVSGQQVLTIYGIVQPAFSITLAPTTVSMKSGGGTTFKGTVTPVENAVSQSITLAAPTELPAGMVASLSTYSIALTNSPVNFTVTLGAGTAPNGHYLLKFAGQQTSAPQTATSLALPVTIGNLDINEYHDALLVGTSDGMVFAYYAAYVTGGDAGSCTSQFRNASLFDYNMRPLYGPSASSPTTGTTPNIVSFNSFAPILGLYNFSYDVRFQCNGITDEPVRNFPLTYPAPTISRIQPNQTASGTTVSSTITGKGLGAPSIDGLPLMPDKDVTSHYTGITSVSLTAPGASAVLGTSPTVAGQNTGSSVPVSITVPPSTAPGKYSLTLTALGHVTNAVDFWVNEPSPVISSITYSDPSNPLVPGGTSYISIYGENLGGSGYVSIYNVATSTWALPGDVTAVPGTYWVGAYVPGHGNTQANVQLAAGPDAGGTYNIYLWSNGANGISFVHGPLDPGASNLFAQSNPKPIIVRQPTWIFLIHGIHQHGADMDQFKTDLIDELRNYRKFNVVDSVNWPPPTPPAVPPDFIVDDSFDFGDCAANGNCGNNCTIDNGADRLASTIVGRTVAGRHVILIGYSMGGLIARDMMLRAPAGFITPSPNNAGLLARSITALITLGTPHLGYPWAPIDDTGGPKIEICPLQMDEMASDFRSGQATLPDATLALSATPPGYAPASVRLPQGWLDNFAIWWSTTDRPSKWPTYWHAISGRYCNDPIRTSVSLQDYGCPNYNPWSDGIVCDQSSRYQLPNFNDPNAQRVVAVEAVTHTRWLKGPDTSDAFNGYAHTTSSIMCGSGLFFDDRRRGRLSIQP